MIHITRRERFSSAHKLENKSLSHKENCNIFGACYNVHGHNYELFVTVRGKVNPKTGFITNLKDLKKLLKKLIISKLDHQVINEVSFMKNKIASTENVCIAIWEEIYQPIKNELNCELFCVKVLETENNIFEYFGKK
tara:strand:- start:1083 stop:1493 length:411 start_codon:yes stop_codon:yes gene_type:complete